MTNPAFTDVPHSPREHFRLFALAAAARLIDAAGRALGSHEALLETFPFVVHYLDEMDRLGALPADGTRFAWREAIRSWEASAEVPLPMRDLARAAGLDYPTLELLVGVGLIEEDPGFGGLFESAQSGTNQARPTLGLCAKWWSDGDGRAGVDDARIVQERIRRLRELALVEVTNTDLPRHQWAVQVPLPVWDALRGEFTSSPPSQLQYVPFASLERSTEPLVDETVLETLRRLPSTLRAGQVDAVIVRGPHHNGRFTVLQWLARALGRGVLHIELSGKPEADAARIRCAGALSTLLHALPVLRLEPLPGETLDVPALQGADCPVGVILGKHGGVRGESIHRAVTLTLELPAPALRLQHLSESLGRSPHDCEALSRRLRLTSGNLRRAASLAQTHAALNGREVPAPEDFREATRTLGRQALETLATPLASAGDWADFSAASETLRELRGLEHRCRFREELHEHVGKSLARSVNSGVRALFQGPSGTGKTLAARLLASALDRDLYRVDLAAVVNKYIGETEKNLARIFAAAEELDVVLLFDEGDALLARRTGVSSANDRYANLETNFLLQRLESFEGIAVVTTNAAELIDDAFQRRMDAVIDFRAPEPPERWALWQIHLPEDHRVDTALLREAASRCQLTGGQIRNAVLHASLLALSDGGVLCSEHLDGAIRREYRKSGGVCPLRTPTVYTGRA